MSDRPQSGAATKRAPVKSERRASRRCKMKQLMLVRPSDPMRDNFDDLRGTQSVSRTGVYFQTSESKYSIGMRVYVTLPYTQDASVPGRDYLAEVVRKEQLPNGLTGIGLKLLLEIPPQHNYSFEGAPPQK